MRRVAGRTVFLRSGQRWCRMRGNSSLMPLGSCQDRGNGDRHGQIKGTFGKVKDRGAHPC